MNFEDLRLRTPEQHMNYIGFVLAQGEYVIKVDWSGAHFCEVPTDKKSEPAPCMHAPFINPDMFLVAVRQLESGARLVRLSGAECVWKGQTLWYCLELAQAQAANAA